MAGVPLNPAAIRSYQNAMGSGLFGPPAPAPGAAVAPAMSGIPGTPGGSQNAAIATAQAPGLRQAFLNQIGPMLSGGSSMSGIPGTPGASMNAAAASANPGPSWQQALATMRGMNPGMFGGIPASGISPLTGTTPNAAMINPAPANPYLGMNPFAARIAGLGGYLGGSPYGANPYAGAAPQGFNPFQLANRFRMF